MKPFQVLTLLCFLAGIGCSATAQVARPDSVPVVVIPRIVWTPRQMDVGKIPFGVPLVRSFSVKNNSDSALLIKNVRTGCHCTTATWATDSIAPGKTGTVEVTFDALKEEEFYKVIIVYTNQDVEQPVGLIFKGFVLKKPADPDQPNVLNKD